MTPYMKLMEGWEIILPTYTDLTEQKRVVCFGLLFVLTGSNLVQTGLEFSLQ